MAVAVIIRRMRFTTQWRAAFRVKSFKAVVIRGKLPGEGEGDGGGGVGRWGRLEIGDRWWRSHVAEMLISWGGGSFCSGRSAFWCGPERP